MTIKKEVFLILEPGFKEYKEKVIIEISKKVDIFFVCGLSEITDYSWLNNYGQYICKINYKKDYIETIESFILNHKLKIIGATNLIDPAFPYLIDIQKKFNISISSKNNFLNSKIVIRDMLSKSKSNFNPKYQTSINKNIAYPVILKPSTMMASLGVSFIENENQMLKRIRELKNIDFEGENLREYYNSITSEVIIEEFIKGIEYSAECYIKDGIGSVIATFQKELDGFEEIGDSFVNEPIINDHIQEIINSIGFMNGILHIEYKIVNQQIKIIEINPRIGGDYIPKMLNHLGIDIGKMIIESYCKGFTQSSYHIKSKSKCSARYEISSYSGILNYKDIKLTKDLEIQYLKKNASYIHKNERILEQVGKKLIKGPDLFSINQELVRSEHPTPISIFTNFRSIHILHDIECNRWKSEHTSSLESFKERINNGEYFSIYNHSTKKFIGFIFGKYTDDDSDLTWKDVNNLDNIKSGNIFYIISISIIPNQKKYFASRSLSLLANFLKSKGKKLKYGIRMPN